MMPAVLCASAQRRRSLTEDLDCLKPSYDTNRDAHEILSECLGSEPSIRLPKALSMFRYRAFHLIEISSKII